MLRSVLEDRPETVGELDLAAETRFWDGLELLTARRTDAGIYLLGYTVEMLLKTAFIHLDGVRPATPIDFGPARQWAPDIPRESYHSLWF